jgi:hypothetical protein
MTKLSMGSSQTMQRSSVTTSRDINFGNKQAGSGAAAATMQTAGSSKTMERYVAANERTTERAQELSEHTS